MGDYGLRVFVYGNVVGKGVRDYDRGGGGVT